MRHVLIAVLALVCAVAANAQFASSDLLAAKEGCFTQLSAPIDASVTSIPVTAGTGTRCAVNQVVIVESEKMLVTAAAANALTVTRGYASTTAATHASGLYVSSNVFQEYHNRLVTALQALVGTDNLVDPARLAPSPDGTKCLKGDKTWGACGTGGGTSAVNPHTVTATSSALTIGGCSASVPCVYSTGGVSTSFTAAASTGAVTASGSATAYLYWLPSSKALVLGIDGTVATAVAAASGVTVTGGITDFPATAVKLYAIPVSGAGWGTPVSWRSTAHREVMVFVGADADVTDPTTGIRTVTLPGGTQGSGITAATLTRRIPVGTCNEFNGFEWGTEFYWDHTGSGTASKTCAGTMNSPSVAFPNLDTHVYRFFHPVYANQTGNLDIYFHSKTNSNPASAASFEVAVACLSTQDPEVALTFGNQQTVAFTWSAVNSLSASQVTKTLPTCAFPNQYVFRVWRTGSTDTNNETVYLYDIVVVTRTN